MAGSTRKGLNIVLALLVAVSGWIYVIYNFNPTYDVMYRGVEIDFTGEETLAANGLALSDVSDTTVDIKLTQRRVDTGKISADSISVVADVSDAGEGDNGISLQITVPENTSVKSVSTRSISVSVEEAETEEFEVEYEFSESPDASLEPIVSNVSVQRVLATGTSKDIDKIAEVKVLVDFSDVGSETKTITEEPLAYDSDGKVIENVYISPDEVTADISAGYTKEVKLVANVTDGTESDDDDDDSDKGDGYTRTYEIPDTVVIKGSADAIANIDSIGTEDIDISVYDEDTEIELTYDLPSGVEIADDSEGQTIKVTVKKSE